MTTVEQWLGEDNEMGQAIWNKKYCYSGENFTQWLDRVSNGNSDLRRLILEQKFLFGGRVLANRGTQNKGKKVVYQNCFVIPSPNDSIDSIYETAGRMAKIFSMGGGVGIDIGGLAPRGAKINNSAETTTGVVSFMPTYDAVGAVIGQSGRRAAMIITLPDNHPDLVEFINCKTELKDVTMANISVKISDDFMKNVDWDKDWELKFERHTGEMISKSVKAREILDLIAKNSWDNAEPGVLFWNNIQKHNMLADNPFFTYGGVNPCGELPLPTGVSENGNYIWGGACNLGSMNLTKYIADNRNDDMDWYSLYNDTKTAFKAMNELLFESIPLLPYKELQDSVSDWRMNGMGHMGLASVFAELAIKYGDGYSISLAGKIQKTILNACVEASIEDVEKYGTYKHFNPEYLINNNFFLNNISAELREKVLTIGLANATFCTVAPTGSLSSMLNVSSGIEPYFQINYTRTTKSIHDKDVDYEIFVKEAKEWLLREGFEAQRKEDTYVLPSYFVASHDISFSDRIAVQAMVQEYNDGAISSTINLPEEITESDISILYQLAWKQGLKGVTVYRNNCRRAGILNTVSDKKPDKDEKRTRSLKRGDVISVDDNVVGLKRRLTTGCGTVHCIAFFCPSTGELMETYLSKGSTGGCNNSLIGLSRMASIAARSGVDILTIVDQLKSTGACPSYAVSKTNGNSSSKGTCCPMAVGYALLDMYEEMKSEIDCDDEISEIKSGFDEHILDNANECPTCNETLTFQGGCNFCRSCGWTRCE